MTVLTSQLTSPVVLIHGAANAAGTEDGRVVVHVLGVDVHDAVAALTAARHRRDDIDLQESVSAEVESCCAGAEPTTKPAQVAFPKSERMSRSELFGTFRR